ncbi:MAG: hypothetical protein ACK5V3_13590 [Bdellovibrionales bacterium]
MKTLILLMIICFLGCGSQDPFSRGQKSAQDNNSSAQSGTKPLQLSRELFETSVQPVVKKDCSGCHGNPAENMQAAQSKIVLGRPEESKLWMKAVGMLGHPKRWDKTSAEAILLSSWINGFQAAPPPQAPPVPQPAPPAPPSDEEGALGFFETAVKPLLEKSCTRCHEGREQYLEAKSLITPGWPEKSALYNYASGIGHRRVWTKESQELAVLKKWIELEK